MKHDREREVAEAMRSLGASGLNTGSAGNVSMRSGDGFLISASGIEWNLMSDEDVCLVAMDGSSRGAEPSSEWRVHRDLYRARSDVRAIVHTHSPWATSAACLRRAIPPIHYVVAVARSVEIPCAPYQTFGTQELSDAVIDSIGCGRACLMANHGLIVTGSDIGDAVSLAIDVE